MCAKRVIVDVDVGTDDYLALLILFHAEKSGLVKVEAICCANGNTSIDNVTKNVVRLLETIGRTDVPVYKGVEQPLILHKKSLSMFHGKDGFGDLEHEKEPDISIVKETLAPVALRDLLGANPGEISLICLGPLTNLALAIKLFPDIVSNIKDLWLMGGSYKAVGNTTRVAEFNFYYDPEAVHIVLECMTCPIHIIPWETTLIPTIDFDWRYANLGIKSPALELLTRADKAAYGPSDCKYWYPCDSFAAFVFLNPEKYITKRSSHNAVVELRGELTRGQLLLDHLNEHPHNVVIVEDFDAEKFKDLLLEIEEQAM
ncbi:inosine-uridine preferring nucleoside hydrolase [Aethina tumida]|uniref:inosine-uridine preferring nucleoside hydrolase n=1 Tax=Aethina tumida TaxID=116153 RepID=UPI00096B09BB|nr:inosine-uridine preferring nucleoside hydrolase [Aethina tumida]